MIQWNLYSRETLGTKASVIINQQIKIFSFILPWNLLQLLFQATYV